LSSQAIFVYDENYKKYDFGPVYIFNPNRTKLTLELLKQLKVVNENISVVKPDVDAEKYLGYIHTAEYIEGIRDVSSDTLKSAEHLGIFTAQGIYDAALVRVAGTLTAAKAIVEGKAKVAFNFGGGFHLAYRDKGSGFNVFNDVALAVKFIQRNYNIRRIAIIDFDAHHFIGTQKIFYSDPTVLTISLHESGHFLAPGTGEIDEIGLGPGRGFNVNIPLPIDTYDEIYLYAFEKLVIPFLESFKPELVIQVWGVDTHYLDPLGHLQLSTECYEKISARLKEELEKINNGKTLILGGGGYNIGVTPRAWSLIFGASLGLKVPDKVPKEWLDLDASLKLFDITRMRDERTPSIDKTRKKALSVFVEKLVKRITEIFTPYHDL